MNEHNGLKISEKKIVTNSRVGGSLFISAPPDATKEDHIAKGFFSILKWDPCRLRYDAAPHRVGHLLGLPHSTEYQTARWCVPDPLGFPFPERSYGTERMVNEHGSFGCCAETENKPHNCGSASKHLRKIDGDQLAGPMTEPRSCS